MYQSGSVTRRRFLTLIALAGSLSSLQACAAPTPAQPTAAKPAATQAPAVKTAAPAAPVATAAPATVAAKPAASAAVSTPKRGGRFTVGGDSMHKDFSGMHLGVSTYRYLRALYNTLIRVDENGNPQPELAESWQMSADGRKMTLKLRQGVKFHSGREFTSADVKFTVNHGKDEKTGAQLRLHFNLIETVDTPDKYTVVLGFANPNPLIFDALDVMGMHDESVMPDLNKADAGTGPFKVVSYIPNSEVRMVRFDSYWANPKPYLDEYVISIVPDTSSLPIHLESKAIDALNAPTPNEAVRLKSLPGMTAEAPYGSLAMFHVAANLRKPPMNNKKVRQAINYAIDRERFARTVLQGLVSPTCLMWPKGSFGYFADLEGKYKFDLGKAKALLTEAGYGNGFEITIMTSTQMSAPTLPLGEMLQADLAKIGVKLQVKNVPNSAYLTPWRTGEGWDLAAHNYGRVNFDPGTMLFGAVAFYPKSEGTSPTAFESDDFIKWRDEAASTLDVEKRKALYRKIQEFVLDDCFSMAVAGEQPYWLYHNVVKDLRFNRTSSPIVSDVWLNR